MFRNLVNTSIVALGIFLSSNAPASTFDMMAKHVALDNNTADTLTVDTNVHGDSVFWAHGNFGCGTVLNVGNTHDNLVYPMNMPGGILNIVKLSGVQGNCDITIEQDNFLTHSFCDGGYMINTMDINGTLYIDVHNNMPPPPPPIKNSL